MPELEHRPDGSLWYREEHGGEPEQVAPPGTDEHELRFAERTIPVINLALKLAVEVHAQPESAAAEAEGHAAREDAVGALLEESAGDDHVLVEAAWFLERDARRKGRDELANAAELVELARGRARWESLPDDVQELWDDAVIRWRRTHGE